jgi:hypothetical protein
VRYTANGLFGYAPKTKLSYSLKEVSNSLIFQIDEQSADITAFLSQHTYRASNGILIASSKYPEIKDSGDSKNAVIVFLQGNDSFRNSKLDVTRFVGQMQTSKRKAQVEAALREFVGYIKSLKLAYVPYYVPAPVVTEDYICFEL